MINFFLFSPKDTKTTERDSLKFAINLLTIAHFIHNLYTYAKFIRSSLCSLYIDVKGCQSELHIGRTKVSFEYNLS